MYTHDRFEQIKSKYGILLERIDIEKIGPRMTAITVFIQIARKLLFTGGVILTLERPLLSILIFNFIIQFMIMFLYLLDPFLSKKMLRMAILDEITLIVMNYHSFCFTSFTTVE